MKKNKIRISVVLIIMYYLFMYLLEYFLQSKTIENISKISLLIVMTLFNIILIKERKKINYKKIIVLIMIIGIILRTMYISYTDINERQHDVEEDVGHLAYIDIIYKTGKLPENNKWQFYQQPMHHIISSAWLKINSIIGIDEINAKEGIQNLTAIYSSIIMIIVYCILKELKIKDMYKILVMMIISVHPTFIILSGSINNDILMIMLTFLGMLYLIKWNKKPNYKNTIILALITAFIALTKISGTIIAIPIIYIFLKKFITQIKNSENKRKIINTYIIKFTVFGIIALSLGLSYSIRNYMKFNQKIFYIPFPNEQLYCGDVNEIDRFNIFSKEIIKDTYCHPFEDYNMPAYILKSSLFGEYNLDSITNNNIVPRLLIINNIIMITISLVALMSIICRYEKIKRPFKLYLNVFLLMFIVQIAMYLISNLTMPYGCTMDFRYIVPTIFTGMMFIIINMLSYKKDKNSILKSKIIYMSVTIFSLSSIIFEVFYMEFLTI